MRRATILAFSLLPLACVEATPRPSGTTLTAVANSTSTATKPAPPASAPRAAAIDRAWLKTYASTRRFRLGAPQRAQPTPDGKAVLFLRSGPRDPKQSLFETDLTSGQTREILTADALLTGPETISATEKARRERMRISARGLAMFELSDDGATVLVPISGRLFVFDRASGKSRELKTHPGAIDPHFSPDGKSVAYVSGNDVYLAGVDAPTDVAVTKGGTDTRTHGVAEFVAQEELARSRGFWFSPEGDRILYEEADTSKVEVLTIPDPSHPEQKPYESAYPRAGKANAEVRLGIVPVRGGATTWIAWDEKRFPYVATVKWSKGAPLTIYVMDRLQQNAELLAVDVATGKTSVLVKEHDSAWINLDASVPRFTPDGTQFLWSSERGGAWELELRDKAGPLVRKLTKKDFGYDAVVDLDVASSTVIVQASSEPTDARVFAVSLAGGEPKSIAGNAGEYVHATFGKGHDVFVTRYATRGAMPRYDARWVNGGHPPVEIPAMVEAPALPNLELTDVGDDHYRVAIIRPRAFVAGQSYPIIDAAYGGPGVNVVASDASRYLFEQWIADAVGAVVVAIDARGTPGRERAWERALKNKALEVPLDGHIAALKALAAKYHELDLSRVGVYGWSYGGMFSGAAVLARPDVYKVAVAGAPVTDWRDYDTCYTERYLGLPESNAAAYDAASLFTWAGRSSPDRPHRPLLVIHGTADDNVYFMNSLKLADALERAGRTFEFLPIAGVTHMLVEPVMIEAVWSRAAEFLRAGLRSQPVDAAK